MIDRRGTIAFGPSLFGADVVGGAEIVLREIAQRLQGRGWSIEVLTTVAESHYTWAPVFAEGESVELGLPVRRFPLRPPLPEHGDLEARLIRGEVLTITEQDRWLNTSMRSPELYAYLAQNHTRYRAMIFGPYPTWLSAVAAQLSPARTVLWACIHDEPYARLDVLRHEFTDIAGLLLQSDPEKDLLDEITPRQAPSRVVGCGVEIPAAYDPERFRREHGLGDIEFLLYAGRREGGKGWEGLLADFRTAVVDYGSPLHLVTMGVGEVTPPPEIAHRVHDVGRLSDEERDSAMAAAAAYVQPSALEAFSRTVMEAWLAGTPVLGSGLGEVVPWHIRRSGAGIVYSDRADFIAALEFVAQAPQAAAELGRRGRPYVQQNYTWDAVLDRVEQALADWTCAA